MLLALLLAANTTPLDVDCTRQGERCRQGRESGRTGGLAFFEFAPASGAGMGAACDLPNWITKSEQFDGWGALGSAGKVPVVTANQAVAPDGTLTADRLQTASAANATEYSELYWDPTLFLKTDTYSIYLKGVSGSGTLRLGAYAGATYPSTVCSYTSTEWSRCTLTTSAETSAFSRVYIGPRGVVGDVDPAADVYVWGAMLNVGSTAGTYRATTTVAVGATATGAKGEVMTFSRASTATCTKAGTTTGIANGDVVLIPSNYPRIMPGGDGTGALGILVESARTNSALRSQELDNASWGKVSTVGLPTVTADFATAPDGTQTAERFVANATSGANYAAIQQTGGCPLAASSVSMYVRGNGTSGTIQMVTSSPITCVTCSYNSTSWSRCTSAVTAMSAGGTFVIGNDSTDCGGVAASAQDVFVWGAQCEAGAYATSYMPTAGASATRVADVPRFTGVAPTLGTTVSIAETWVTTAAIPGTVVPLLMQNVLELYTTATQKLTVFHYPSTTTTISAQSIPTSGASRLVGYADGTNVGSCVDGVCTTAAHAGSFAGSPWTIYLGSELGSAQVDGVLKLVCVDPAPGRCR